MTNKTFKSLLAATAASLAFVGAAEAGGLERSGYNIDLLFEQGNAFNSSAAYVMPNRKLKNVVDTDSSDGPMNAVPGVKNSANESEAYWVPYLGAKIGYNDVDCMIDYSQPWGAHTNPGANWAGAQGNIETDIGSNNYAATCSYKFQLSKGSIRFIGGAFYQELSGFKQDLVAPAAFSPLGQDIYGKVALKGDGWGWRAGLAYEIPEIALRASLVYNSKVDLGDITGDLTVGVAGAPASIQDVPIYGNAEMPQSVELKLQSGIAPGWLAFGSVKWTDWSELDRIGICPVATKPLGGCDTTKAYKATSLDLHYRDGWTVTAGIGHQFNEQWSGAAQIGWDRGTSQGFGSQTDTWTVGGGVSYKPQDNIEIRLGGALGILTSGNSKPYFDPDADGGAGETVGSASYDFGNDLVSAVQASFKIKF